MYEAEIAATLDWCNEQRQANGQEPLAELPKGRRGDSSSCPCGAATGLWVTSENAYMLIYPWRSAFALQDFETKRPLPVLVQGFVRVFDDGCLPQFEMRSSR